MPDTIRIGGIEVLVLSDGVFRLDGGSMFGIVPRPLWEAERGTDEEGRVTLACNCFLILAGKTKILVDSGIGRKFDEKRRRIYALDGRTLPEELAAAGFSPRDVDFVVNTHLHMDHAGWNASPGGGDSGGLVPTFPNARYVVERRELYAAGHPTELNRRTYLPENWVPVANAGLFLVYDWKLDIVPGVTVFRTGGHTPGHACVMIRDGGRTAVAAGDLLPTSSHRRVPWATAYDMFPVETMDARRWLLREAARKRWLLLCDHEPEFKAFYLKEGAIPDRYEVEAARD
ncbi:MAG: MBL fold metallo-hydrolase [Planctomycetota bacterium]|nr:MBL fold metallo-hydrolase [Planctomycetota bacterium]